MLIPKKDAAGGQAEWYALYVRCNQEKSVVRGLSSRGVEYFLPCYQSLRQWKDRRVMLEMALFPGYVFVRLLLLKRNTALMVPNVVSLVGTRNVPSVISQEEIAWIKLGLEHGCAQPHDYLEAGQRVLITEGALCGMEGILLRRQNRTRVVVSLNSISRAFVVDVDAAWVKPTGASGVHAQSSALTVQYNKAPGESGTRFPDS